MTQVDWISRIQPSGKLALRDLIAGHEGMAKYLNKAIAGSDEKSSDEFFGEAEDADEMIEALGIWVREMTLKKMGVFVSDTSSEKALADAAASARDMVMYLFSLPNHDASKPKVYYSFDQQQYKETPEIFETRLDADLKSFEAYIGAYIDNVMKDRVSGTAKS